MDDELAGFAPGANIVRNLGGSAVAPEQEKGQPSEPTVRACRKIPNVVAARRLRAERDATSESIGKEIREREATKPQPAKNRRRKIAIFRHALKFCRGFQRVLLALLLLLAAGG
jgi:hypothetical protein